jgi:hypothetical protein
MGKPKVYESNAQRQQAYRHRRAAKGKTIDELAHHALEILHREVKADAARGDDDQARFAKAALGRSPLETVLKVMFYAELCDPTYDDFADFCDVEQWEQASLDESRRKYLKAKAEVVLAGCLMLDPSKLKLRLKRWDNDPDEAWNRLLSGAGAGGVSPRVRPAREANTDNVTLRGGGGGDCCHKTENGHRR